jgi:adenylylsulfate kinase-like enzyme
VEIYISTPLEVCEKRDVKGLYAKARRGEISNFTGISAPYEEPENPDLIIDTSELSVEDAVELIYAYLLPKLKKVYE